MGGMDAKHDTISIHTPLAGSDPDSHTVTEAGSIFQSTLPLRGATICGGFFVLLPYKFQSTLPLRGATKVGYARHITQRISIHTPLAGSDLWFPIWRTASIQFQSTLPLRGATRPACPPRRQSVYFNPHSPCGERPTMLHLDNAISVFQSTLPLRGATVGDPSDGLAVLISIHTPLAGSDQPFLAPHVIDGEISIHTPLAGSDSPPTCRTRMRLISIHTPLAGSDSPALQASSLRLKFQSTLPLRGATLQICRPVSV